MNTVFLFFFTTLIYVAALGQNAATQETVSQSNAKLDFTIELSKLQFRVAEPIVVCVTITNQTATPVKVTFWGKQNDQPIVNFRIIASNGSKFWFSTKQNRWCGTGIENAAILANREYRFSVDLLKTWECGGARAKLPPGIYTISAALFSMTVDGANTKVAESGQVKFTVLASQYRCSTHNLTFKTPGEKEFLLVHDPEGTRIEYTYIARYRFQRWSSWTNFLTKPDCFGQQCRNI